jgi:(p)ppGpp synthase/HD superfamily hydrolase
MLKMNTVAEKIVAILHDVLEDTNCTIEEFREIGLNYHTIHSIEKLTKKPYQTYEDFIQSIREDEIAVRVKIADIEDNLADKGSEEVTLKQAEKNREKYETALRVLRSHLEYLETQKA